MERPLRLKKSSWLSVDCRLVQYFDASVIAASLAFVGLYYQPWKLLMDGKSSYLQIRLFMVVEETNVEKHDLKQERKRKIAWCMVLVTLLLGGLFAVVYTELIPLLNYRDMNVSNCPLHPLSILGDQKELKYVFVGYVGCSAIIFWSTDDKSKSHFTEEKPNNSVHALVKVLFIVCYYSTIFALVFAIICIPINFLGGSLYSVTFNKVKLRFDIIILAVSIILPALLAHIHASENTDNRGYSMELSRTERMPGLEQRHIKIGMNNNGKKT